VNSYNSDGPMRYRHSGDQPTYAPNSFGGPHAQPEGNQDVTWGSEAGEIARYAYVKHEEDDDFGKAGMMYRKAMDNGAKERLASNIVGHASEDDVEPQMKERVVEYWTIVDTELGGRVAEGLGVKAAAVT
jgi:catalase